MMSKSSVRKEIPCSHKNLKRGRCVLQFIIIYFYFLLQTKKKLMKYTFMKATQSDGNSNTNA